MTSFIRKGLRISHASEFCGIFMSENSEKKKLNEQTKLQITKQLF